MILIYLEEGTDDEAAVVDPTGTGAFSTGTKAEVTQQVPGTFGEISPSGQTLNFMSKMLVKMGLMKRAANVNKDYVRIYSSSD